MSATGATGGGGGDSLCCAALRLLASTAGWLEPTLLLRLACSLCGHCAGGPTAKQLVKFCPAPPPCKPSSAPARSRVALLVGGDAAALLAFAAIGRVSHHEALTLGALVGTAWPFMAGWFGAAALLGGYGKAAQGGDAGAAAGAAAKAWAVGIPVGLLLRSASRGYFPDPSFIGVAMAANGVLLLGWRTALAAATPQATAPQGRGEQLRARKSRKGNPFEMFQMVFSMVKRW